MRVCVCGMCLILSDSVFPSLLSLLSLVFPTVSTFLSSSPMHSLAQVVRLAIRFAWDNFNKLRQLPFSSNVHMHESVPPIFYLVAMWQYTTKSEYESLLPLIHSSGYQGKKVETFKSQKFRSRSWTKYYSDALLAKPFCWSKWLSRSACNQERISFEPRVPRALERAAQVNSNSLWQYPYSWAVTSLVVILSLKLSFGHDSTG